MEGLYTAREARDKLRVGEYKFQYMVKKGQVRKVILPGRKYGMYSRPEIDELAATLHGPEQEIVENPAQQVLEDKDQEKIIFRRADVTDVSKMDSLGALFMRQSRIIFRVLPSTGTLQKWLANPFSVVGHVLLKGGELIGYSILLPLKHEQTMQIMSREIRIAELEFRDLASLESGEPIDLFIVAMITDPSKKSVGASLLRKMLKFFHTLGKQGIEIEGIYAPAYSFESKALCLNIGMHEITLPSETQSSIPFEMKVKETYNRYTRNYLLALKSYKEKQLRAKSAFREFKHPELKAEAHVGKQRNVAAAAEYESYEEILAAFEQVIQINPKSADAHFGKGAALHFLQREEEAQRAYEKALKLMRKNRAEEAAFKQGGPTGTHDTESPEMGKPFKRHRRGAASDLSNLDFEETENTEMAQPIKRHRRGAPSDLSNLDFEDVDLPVRRHRHKAAVEENSSESAGPEKSTESESNQSHRAKSIDRIAHNPGSGAGEQSSPGTVTKWLPEIPG
jgi:tetratricopeptide (TPR) repeat protein